MKIFLIVMLFIFSCSSVTERATSAEVSIESAEKILQKLLESYDKEFRKIFLEANPNIDDSSIRYFVFFDKDSGEASTSIINRITEPIKEELGNAFDKVMPWVFGITVVYLFFNSKVKK